jgi:hypothetical protein
VDGKHALPDQTLKRVRTEMSLHILAYNMKRVIAIVGIGPLLQAIRATLFLPIRTRLQLMRGGWHLISRRSAAMLTYRPELGHNITVSKYLITIVHEKVAVM